MYDRVGCFQLFVPTKKCTTKLRQRPPSAPRRFGAVLGHFWSVPDVTLNRATNRGGGLFYLQLLNRGFSINYDSGHYLYYGGCGRGQQAARRSFFTAIDCRRLRQLPRRLGSGIRLLSFVLGPRRSIVGHVLLHDSRLRYPAFVCAGLARMQHLACKAERRADDTQRRDGLDHGPPALRRRAIHGCTASVASAGVCTSSLATALHVFRSRLLFAHKVRDATLHVDHAAPGDGGKKS